MAKKTQKKYRIRDMTLFGYAKEYWVECRKPFETWNRLALVYNYRHAQAFVRALKERDNVCGVVGPVSPRRGK